MTYLSGLLGGVQVCLCLIFLGIFMSDFFSKRTRKHGYEHLIDLKSSCTIKRLSAKTVYHGKVVSVYGGRI